MYNDWSAFLNSLWVGDSISCLDCPHQRPGVPWMYEMILFGFTFIVSWWTASVRKRITVRNTQRILMLFGFGRAPESSWTHMSELLIIVDMVCILSFLCYISWFITYSECPISFTNRFCVCVCTFVCLCVCLRATANLPLTCSCIWSFDEKESMIYLLNI